MSPRTKRIRDNETDQPVEVATLTYEQALTELEELVERLEAGAALDEALKLYERGQALAAHCGALLEHAELRLRELTPGASDDETD
ncbi:MAG: exodeoxyribonuclease VII small subunit [Anaerolineales bacterium]|nr:exodeoxyribonuclease VII small subunit [Anaerolineales bacterium]